MMDRRQFTAGFALTMGATLLNRPALAAPAISEKFTCTVMADVATGQTIVRDGPSDRRFTPCSSFKFPLAVMGFDSGVLVDPHHPRWDYRPEFEATMESQKKAADPTIWLADSIVWYS